MNHAIVGATIAAIAACVPTFGDTITYRLETDKTVVMPGEVVTMKLYARSDVAPGSPVIWTPPNGGPPEPGALLTLAMVSFSGMFCEGRTINWVGYEKNPDLFLSQNPNFGPVGLNNAVLINFLDNEGQPKKLLPQDVWLMTFHYTFQGTEPGEAKWLTPTGTLIRSDVWVDVPGYPTAKSDIWKSQYIPLTFTIIPSPSVASGAVVALLYLSRRVSAETSVLNRATPWLSALHPTTCRKGICK